jgi:DNA-binding MarR family transcriptional regulator
VPRNSKKRASLLDALAEAGRELSAHEIMFHGAIADRAGMSATEHKAVDVLARRGPLTAGALAEHTGLTTGAVTGLIDRLERLGYVRRSRDASDRRRVVVEPALEVLGPRLAPLFDDLARRLDALHRRYDDEQLELLLDYTRQLATVLHDATLTLRDGDKPD